MNSKESTTDGDATKGRRGGGGTERERTGRGEREEPSRWLLDTHAARRPTGRPPSCRSRRAACGGASPPASWYRLLSVRGWRGGWRMSSGRSATAACGCVPPRSSRLEHACGARCERGAHRTVYEHHTCRSRPAHGACCACGAHGMCGVWPCPALAVLVVGRPGHLS